MITITKERLQWLANISGRDDIDDIDGGEIRELALIALASLEAEPVGEFYEYKPGDWYQRSVGDKAPKWVPLYAAPPAPGNQVGELTMWVKRLVSQLKKANPDCKLPEKAMDYLKRNELISAEDVLR
ncbi:TPA: hypothetical protein OB637_003789 [Escherichia coli]|uniref:hypothetical protein n=1 Tax=Escherichia coli TaxID=562 RepID=UPI000BE6B3F9|nr:hypothetical protein [Escherichia coli]EFN8609223.1 hypothetical protein [Escherichia coli O83:H28]EFN8661260.1 hypothetical protein [Escherichia coli O2]EEY4099979.1 hypothetical protein [Escherichia coli]EEZ0390822.1 hypothetical protein [Escherichia coli]EEZ9090405.1 hypothetical protein [Escherichia coli]